LITNNRQSKAKVGVVIYVLDQYSYKCHQDIEIKRGDFETIFINIEKHNILVGEVYRIPNTNEPISVEIYNKLITNVMNTKLDVIRILQLLIICRKEPRS